MMISIKTIKIWKHFWKKITCCETNDDCKIVSGIYTKYKDVRNKKLAHSTNVDFT